MEFDAQYYLRSYPDVRAAGIDPQEHYFKLGWKEGRNPSSHFDTIFYRTAVSGAIYPGLCPLSHYEERGRTDGAPRNRTEARNMGGYQPNVKELMNALTRKAILNDTLTCEWEGLHHWSIIWSLVGSRGTIHR
jgi:hypothetical protein